MRLHNMHISGYLDKHYKNMKEVEELEVGKDIFGRKKNFINLPYDKYIKMKRTCEMLGMLDKDKAEFEIYKKQQQEMLKKQKQNLKIILVDLRPSCMGLSDLLKMLDNNTSSTVKSRYKNKVLECDV